MKKFFLSITVILTFIVYSLYQRFGRLNKISTIAPSGIGNIVPGIGSTFGPEIKSPTIQPTSGRYKDGVYAGDVADAYYGNVQVRVVISGGKITDVQFLDYPKDRRTSIEINTRAMPYLKTEAIQTQSANVDIISGATQTSRAFRESLQSVLNQAKV